MATTTKPLAKALANVIKTVKRQAGIAVTITRGGNSHTTTAVPAETPVELVGDEDVSAHARFFDWLFDPADYQSPTGTQVDPRRDDKITVTEAGHDAEDHVYQAAETPIDRQVWRHSDEAARAFLRVHTVLVDDGD